MKYKRKSSKELSAERLIDPRVGLAQALRRLFSGRTDVYAVGTRNGFRPEFSSLSVERLAGTHLEQKTCFGFYLMDQNNCVKCTAVDFDDKPNKPDPECQAKVTKLCEYLAKLGLEPTVELSQGGRGYHVWLFFKDSMSAQEVRQFWQKVSEQIGVKFHEVFPKQDTLTGKNIGNLIRYPLWNKSQFVRWRKEFQPVEAKAFLNSVPQLTAAEFRGAAKKLKSTPTKSSIKKIIRNKLGKDTFDRRLAAYAEMDKGSRSEAQFALLTFALRKGMTSGQVWAKVRHVGKFAERNQNWFKGEWRRAQESVEKETAGDLKVVRMGSVQPKVTEWLWADRIPLGAIVLLDGDPGLGKSQLTLEIAARITRGWLMPPNAPVVVGEPGSVLIVTAEDDLARTIRTRLEAAQADIDRVLALTHFETEDGRPRLSWKCKGQPPVAIG